MKITHTLLAMLFIAFAGNAQTNHVAKTNNALVARTYSVQPNLDELARPIANASFNEFGTTQGDSAKQDANANIKKFLMDAGVPFPEGSSIKYNRAASWLLVVNTEENHAKLEYVLAPDCMYSQVEIVMSLLRTTGPTNTILRQESIFNPSQLKTLSSNGCAIIDSISGITKSGVASETANGKTDLSFTPVIAPDGRTVDVTLTWGCTDTNGINHSINTSVLIEDRQTLVLQAKHVNDSIEFVTLSVHFIKTDGTPIPRKTLAK